MEFRSWFSTWGTFETTPLASRGGKTVVTSAPGILSPRKGSTPPMSFCLRWKTSTIRWKVQYNNPWRCYNSFNKCTTITPVYQSIEHIGESWITKCRHMWWKCSLVLLIVFKQSAVNKFSKVAASAYFLSLGTNTLVQ